MARIIALSALVLVLYSGATAGDTGIGIILGEPTGLSMKHWLTARNALAGGLSWSFEGDGALYVHVDYLIHFTAWENDMPENLTFRWGIGGRLVLPDEGDEGLGARLPLGAELMLQSEPIGFFLELVPVLELVPETDFDLDGGIGCRIYF